MTSFFAGVGIGHVTDHEHHTGCTVFLCPPGTTGSVDVRGPAPGSREAALLAPDKRVSVVHAVVLSGGSAFGLATADGVMRYLGEQGVGHPTPVRPIPIVPAAIVYDLFLGGGAVLPDAAMGYAAAQAAAAQAASGVPVVQGNAGAATGVTVGKWGGFQQMMKGGFGVAGVALDGLDVWAAAVVNAVGDVVNADGSVLAGARTADGTGWLADEDPYRRFPERPPVWVGTNTTLVVIATNALLDKTGCNRLAQRGHDGLAQALRPAHTSHDGDTVFALATGNYEGEREAGFDLVANVAVEMVAAAIRNGVRAATSVPDVPGLGVLPGLAGRDG
jgi:L-aminopeptidase/D-esterase-like protein